MGKKTLLADPNDPEFIKESAVIDVSLEVQEFESTSGGIELPEEVNQKVIAYLEKLIRKSYEYKQYITYLKSELDITKCAITPSLDIKEYGIGLEFHHYPLTLYDIADTILRKYLYTKKENDTVSLFNVMEEVMKEHYLGDVGLVPLTKTAHEMAHNGSLKIPISAVNGKYENFMNKYYKYLTPEMIEKIQNATLITDDIAKEFNNKLEKNILNYEVKYNKSETE